MSDKLKAQVVGDTVTLIMNRQEAIDLEVLLSGVWIDEKNEMRVSANPDIYMRLYRTAHAIFRTLFDLPQ